MRTVQLELLRPGEILAERERCSIVYLPVGPLEWHGPAMPYGTDALLAQSLARCAAERTGGVVMPTLFIGTERERPASILRDKGFENPERLYVLGMDVPKNSMKSFYAREDMFAVIVREHLRLLVQQGYRLIVIVNGHGAWGQTATLERLAVEFSHETPSKVIVGFPTIARQGMASLASALMNIQGAVYGDAAVAALTISNKIYLLVRNVMIGIGQGFQPVAGYNYGAGNRKRTRQAFIFATKLGTVICILAAGIIAAFAEPIIGWFRADDQVIAIGRLALLYACAVMPFMAYSTFVNQLYQCLGYKLPATVLASLRQGICYLPLIFILPHFLGLQGVQMTQPGSDLLTFFICIPFQIVFFRKHLRDNA